MGKTNKHKISADLDFFKGNGETVESGKPVMAWSGKVCWKRSDLH